jgi:hypothetical protein
MVALLVTTALASTAWLPSGPAAAGESKALSPGERSITLVAADGTRLPVGRISLAAREGGGFGLTVKLDGPEFTDEFLSMRPFRCLTVSREMWCHLPYPYETSGIVRDGDLVDLEYALLFLFKPPTAYGIDAWNGLYFKLTVEPDGSIAGTVNEVNLDVLATPPNDRAARVIGHGDLTPVGLGSHAFARVEIR